MLVRGASLALLLLAAAGSGGCAFFDRDCDRPFDKSEPGLTIETFHRAFRCDDAEQEYRCFSSAIKRRFGTFTGYSLGRDILKSKDPLAIAFIKNADLDGRVRITIEPDGIHALARIDIGEDRPLEVRLLFEPEYRLHHQDGKTSIGLAQHSTATSRESGVVIEIVDPGIELESRARIVRADLSPRWVIDDFPGLSDAIAAALSDDRRP
jgi:hypothetical protein